MSTRTKYIVSAVAITVIGAGVGTVAVGATTGDNDQTPIVGAELERASSAALAYTGQGRVTETEVGDEDSYYEVEVTLVDGSQVDVQLDRDFRVIGSSADHEDDEIGESDDS